METLQSFEPSGTTCPMTERHVQDDLYLPHANFFTTLNFNERDNKQVANSTETLLHGTNKSYFICIWKYKNRGHSTVCTGATFLGGWHKDCSNDTVSNRQQFVAVHAGDDIQRNVPNVHIRSGHTTVQNITTVTWIKKLHQHYTVFWANKIKQNVPKSQ